MIPEIKSRPWGTGGKRRASILLASILCGGLNGTSVSAAQPWTESFDAGTAGWLTSGAWQITTTNGYVQGRFPEEVSPSPNILAVFTATNSSSGGAFVGDYEAEGIAFFGFSFQAVDVLPSELILRWRGAGNVYFRSMTHIVTGTGIWFHALLPLNGKESGGWVGSAEADFQSSLADVSSVELLVSRTGTATQRYRLDRFFTGIAPSGSRAGENIEASASILWSSLHDNIQYSVASTTNLISGSWSTLESFRATTHEYWWTPPETVNSPIIYYRLLGIGD